MSSDALFTDLTAYAGLTALVNNGDSPLTYRIYPRLMKQDDDLPAVVYQLITGQRMNTLSDSGGTGVEQNMYQLTAWAMTLTQADAVIEQCRLALKDATREYVPLSRRETYDTETRLYGVSYDFHQWYR